MPPDIDNEIHMKSLYKILPVPRFGGNRITIEELDIYTLPSIWE